MEFITVEQFKEQPVGVQKVFLDWWNESRYDLVCLEWDATKELVNEMGINLEIGIKNKISTYEEIIIYLNNLECLGIENKELIPLFTEGQLRRFIEDKSNGIVKLIQWHIEDSQISKRGYAIDILRKNEYHVTYHYKDLGEDLLQAYWKVACMVAKEGLNG
ncbi:hypothetical protein PMY12_18615 [Clostridium tertium]|uniref:hypothetical protein n=1 Tax=Clostridium tertium TaxID=1559 RepID=UPI00232D4D30|nr:hypothetical protein [Clostridium tertium]MDB1935258.1 hypothetical protein [Clostridium tertium]MDB1939022.1 hypothetical protein [Clostridium tertium]